MNDIEPFIEHLDKHNFQSRKFQINDYTLVRLTNNWLRLTVNWKAEKEEYKFKYPEFGGCSFGPGAATSVRLKFPALRGHNFLEIGVYDTVVNYDGTLDYHYLFFQNIKYGVSIYFPPRDWEETKYVLFHSEE